MSCSGEAHPARQSCRGAAWRGGIGLASFVVILLWVAAPAAAGDWVRLTSPAVLRKAPADPPLLGIGIPATDEEGSPVQLPVLRSATRDGRPWLKVRFSGLVGWIPAASTSLASADALPPAVRAKLTALLAHAGPRAGAVVADASGRPLFQQGATRRLILASNTKIFTTAAAFAQFGPTIQPLLGEILRPSNNVLAERLFVRLGGGDRADGQALAEQFARSRGSRVQLWDGSGLSRRDRSTPGDVVSFLVSLRRSPGFGLWRDALPVAGRSGTLRGRMRDGAAAGRCQAKTGTLHDVSALSGYCTTTAGRRVVFSILMNGISPWKGRALQDRVLESVVARG